jgi:hypothetical protein
VTGREASFLLIGTLPHREHARLVLAAGFAGEVRRTPASLLYDERAVRSWLAGRSSTTVTSLSPAHGGCTSRGSADPPGWT